MKKIYLSILSLTAVSMLNAQVSQSGPMKRTFDKNENHDKPVLIHGNQHKATPLWENDFSNAGDWVISNNTGDSQDWIITTSTDPNMGYGTGPWVDAANSVSNENGYALYDSDAVGTNGGSQNADITYNGAVIDLSLYANVVIEFAQRGRMWTNTQTIVQVSNDGGSNWSDFPVNLNKQQGVRFEEVTSVNISSAAGLQSDVKVRFKYIGSWDYMWAVDDVKIFEQPDEDIQIISAYIAGENNEGIEYGRYQKDNMDANWIVGAEVYNFGVNDQTNLAMTADFTSFSFTYNEASLLADDTVAMEGTETPTLSTGLYQGTYTVVSDGETSLSDNFDNNVFLRNFEVTDNLYSQDGIDVYPAQNLSLTSLGTNSFTDGADGLVLATLYHIKQPTVVTALEIELGSSTVAGGDVIASIIDTTNLFADDTTPMFQSGVNTVTAAHVSAGRMVIPFLAPITLNPGAFFAAVELYSNGNASDIRVLDDVTVPQPSTASMIFIPNDQSYTNGTALAIRLRTSTVGIDELGMNGISTYPNPSKGLVNITNDNKLSNTIVVYDMLGNEILTKVVSSATSIDLTSVGTGVYIVKISNEKGSKIERVVIQ